MAIEKSQGNDKFHAKVMSYKKLLRAYKLTMNKITRSLNIVKY